MNQDRPKGKRGHRSLRQPLSLSKKLLFSAIATVALLLVAELVLFVFWTPPPETDPYVGFSASVPLLVQSPLDESDESSQTPRVQINPTKWVWFNSQSFPATKPPGTIRIVCLGGSTTYGRPFSDTTSFSGWLRVLLPMIDSDRQWEVINAGGISYASYRVARVMEEFAQYDVDLFVLYTGHNEFLEWRTYGDLMRGSESGRYVATWVRNTRLGRAASVLVDRSDPASAGGQKHLLSAEVDEMLNHSIGPSNYVRDPQWHQGVTEHFRLNLQRMKQISAAAGARLAVITPVSNRSDCAPFKSDFSDSVDDVTRERLREQLQLAKQMDADGAYELAAETLRELLQVDRQNAEARYVYGRTLMALQQHDLALEQFLAAIDQDICPLRAPAAIVQAVHDFCDDPDVIAVDFEGELNRYARQTLGHQCYGAESFLDHVHPTIQMHGKLARTTLDVLAREGIVPAGPTDDHVAAASLLIENSLDRRTLAVAFRNLAKLTHWAGKFEEAQRHAQDALRLIPDDPESRYILADCLNLTGHKQQALGQYERLFQAGGFDRALLPFGQLLAELGHYEAAKAYLIQAVVVSEEAEQFMSHRAASYRALGNVHLALGEDRLAEDCFERAER